MPPPQFLHTQFLMFKLEVMMKVLNFKHSIQLVVLTALVTLTLPTLDATAVASGGFCRGTQPSTPVCDQ
jgi:hypothetical protein